MAKKVYEDIDEELDEDLDEEDDEELDEDLEDDEEDSDEEGDDEDEDLQDEEDNEEDDEEEEDTKSKPIKKQKSKENPEDRPVYTAKHLSKIISAKHNKMKNQFSKKLEEVVTTHSIETDQANAIINWLTANSGLNREQILAKVGYVPTNKKPNVDKTIFDNLEGDSRTSDELDAEVNQIQSRPSRYPGFRENKKMIVEYAKDTGLPVDKAYWALMGADAAKAAKAAALNEATQRKQTKRSKVTESAGATDKVKTHSKGDISAAKAAGMSVEDYVKYSKIDSYEDYQKANRKKKKK